MTIRSRLTRRVKSALQVLTKHVVYEVEYGDVTVKRRGGLGMLRRKSFNRLEKKFLSSLPLQGKTIYDIGAHIGILSVFFSKAAGSAGSVIAIEPNHANCAKIAEHIKLNGVANVELLRVGVGDKKGPARLVVRASGSGTGTLDVEIQAQIAREGAYEALQVEIDTLDALVQLHNLPAPDFIKLDVEKSEYPALIGMAGTVRCCSPELYVEIHGADTSDKRANILRIMDLLSSWKYRVLHVESQTVITQENAGVAKEGHIYCVRE